LRRSLTLSTRRGCTPSRTAIDLVNEIVLDIGKRRKGLFLYYPGHRQVPATLRALIDMIRTARGPASTRRSLKNPFTED
jgi:hypothetical protein